MQLSLCRMWGHVTVSKGQPTCVTLGNFCLIAHRGSQKHSCQSSVPQQAVEERINADSIHFQDKMTPQRDALHGNSILFQCLLDCILVSSIFSLTMIKGILAFPLPVYGPACCCSQLQTDVVLPSLTPEAHKGAETFLISLLDADGVQPNPLSRGDTQTLRPIKGSHSRGEV